YPLYQSMGKTLKDRFSGWRVGLITSTLELANQTALPFSTTSNPISHGGIGIKIYSTEPLE
ncbi:MAG: hypothetical protein JKY12_08150, partial [Sneathiella sp.]|nr:hypothetical protein [Sneathiella sp.]